ILEADLALTGISKREEPKNVPRFNAEWPKLNMAIFEEADDADDEESGVEEEVDVDRTRQIKLLEQMKEEHAINFKKNILQNIRPDDAMTKILTKVKDNEDIYPLLADLNAKTRLKVLKQTFGKKSKEYKFELKSLKNERKAARAEKKAKKAEKKMPLPVSGPSEPEVIIERGLSFY
uniref:Nucleolar protein 16 n=1 Tax=Panagrellus redivivus TaxID=6233 RepID=A0A7E4VYF3_PANRE